MYSGTTLTKYSGRILGAHQRIDRVARNHLSKIIPEHTKFPGSKQIIHFEGRNGPDGIKIKSPAKDEPWHYYSPFDDDDAELIRLISSHYKNLVSELKKGNKERSAFEAAWLSHALVDGLTPAHHYPYEEKLTELMGGQSIDTRTTTKDKLVLPGENRREQLKNNWKMWGPKGLMSSHGFFELGVATILLPLKFGEAVPKPDDIAKMKKLGVAEWFKRSAREIAVLNMFDEFNKKGWTPKLARQVRQKLGPLIIQTVTLTWYLALHDAGLLKDK